LIECIYQIRCSGHLFCDPSSAKKPFANRTVRNNSNGQFSSVHRAQCIQLHDTNHEESSRMMHLVCWSSWSSRAHLQSGTISGSMSRDQRDHSICTAVIGCTACARLTVSGLASDNPMYLTFPSSTNFLSSPICREFGFGT